MNLLWNIINLLLFIIIYYKFIMNYLFCCIIFYYELFIMNFLWIIGNS